jgi:hypothetical protein
MSLSVLILGTDALAAVAPNSAAQLIHACRKLGFSAVVPVSWGEEIVARKVIEACSARAYPGIQCSCPRVRDRLASFAPLIEESLIVLDPPAVAAARFLRHRSAGMPLHITFVGGCAVGPTTEIDEQLRVEELLAALERARIEVSAEPSIFEDLIPPDMRRFHSQPGGLPDAQRLWTDSGFSLRAPGFNDLAVNVAQALLDGGGVLVDLAGVSGCVCAGASADLAGATRAPSPILPDERLNIES